MMYETCDILRPFAEATDLTRSNKGVTISFVVPSVLDLYGHLNRSQAKSRYCRSLTNALQKALEIWCFFVFFDRCKMLGTFCGEISPFSENVYFMAAALDPVLVCHWIDTDVVGDDEI